MKFELRQLFYPLYFVLFLFVVLVVVWLLTFRLYWAGLYFGIPALALVFATGKRSRWLIAFGMFVSGPFAALATVDNFNSNVERLAVLAPDDYATIDLISVYLGHTVMIVGGFAPFPEVAREAAVLQFGDGQPKRWESDFPTRSTKVLTAMLKMEDKLKKTKKKELRLRPHTIGWDYKRLDSYDEIRVALALNCPLKLEGKARRENDAWYIDYEATCEVSYPQNYQIVSPMIFDERLVFNESLFHALEVRGWLTPYRVTWTYWREKQDG